MSTPHHPSDGPVRITGAYPPPLTPTAAPRARHRAPRAARPRAAHLWAATSAALAAAGLLTVLPFPRQEAPAAPAEVAAVADAPAGNRLPLALPVYPTPGALQLPPSDPVRVRIPALGITSPVVRLGLDGDGAMEVPPAADPVGWYTGSPTPGELGPAVLAGHVDWGGEPGAFDGLAALLPGESVVVQRADGTVATFTVDRVEEHGKDGFPTDRVYGDLDHAGLRLITCGGDFDRDSGDYPHNVIAFASLASTG
ncbi:class F sortase [Modestobacter marinus]|uniref:class F sortase n=1 Tax=Modestobacter marinus TaxID=477641 RepID=UPI0027DF0169|nr:class F sortase [Modestobacter marinus]